MAVKTNLPMQGATSAGKRVLQGARIPVKDPTGNVKTGLKGKYSFEKAWKQATTYDTRPRIERDSRWKDYFAKKQKQREDIIAQSKEPGQLASERFLTEEIDGIRMSPEQARAYKQKKADVAYETESGVDAAAFRELLKPENISKAKKEYLAQLPQDRMWGQKTVDTKYGGTFSDLRGEGFDQWFADNYISKIKKETSPVSDEKLDTYKSLVEATSAKNKPQLPSAIVAPQEDYLSRGGFQSFEPQETATLSEVLRRGTRREKQEATKEIAKTSPVFFNLAAFGNPWATRNLDSFVSSAARKSAVFGPTAFRSGPGLGKSTVFNMGNYPTYGRT